MTLIISKKLIRPIYSSFWAIAFPISTAHPTPEALGRFIAEEVNKIVE
jgi:tellurite resistance protein TehA-like permease